MLAADAAFLMALYQLSLSLHALYICLPFLNNFFKEVVLGVPPFLLPSTVPCKIFFTIPHFSCLIAYPRYLFVMNGGRV